MSSTDDTRASGHTAAEEETREASAQFDQPIASDPLPGDDARDRHHTPGFSRMRTDWRGNDGAVMLRVTRAVDDRIMANFGLAYEIMNTVYEIVRTPELGPTGVPLVDVHGFVQWKRSPTGLGFEEDFSRLSTKDREHLMFQITTNLFSWEQRAAEAWSEAMYAKAIWEESFSVGFEGLTGTRPTVDDRRAAGNIASMDDRFFAIFMSAYSRRADAICRSMERMGQRLRDVITA